MPKAILAMRTYPATLLIALLLFMATLVMTAASMGTAGVGGGDDGDGGSGIGGTGKSGEFGGSGFGGTGGPSPFITSVDDQESVTTTPASDTLEPEIALSQALADPIEQSAVLTDSDNTLVSGDTPNVVEPSIPVPTISLPEKAPEVQLAEARPIVPEGLQPSVVVKQPELARSGDVQVFDEAAVDPQLQIVQQDQSNRSADIAIESLSTAAVAESVSVKLETAAKESEQEIDRNALPDRIQRPDLPPFQRVRPVDRASIMVPSRVQPMRI